MSRAPARSVEDGLENKVVELGIVDRARAQKNTLQPHRRQHWVIPPKANSAFVAAMEDVLAVYTRPRDGDCPLVCLDETSKQLIAETRVPISMKAGRPARFDYEYAAAHSYPRSYLRTCRREYLR